MQALIDVILPVFLLLGAGYAVRWAGLFSQEGVAGLMAYTQTFAIPCLLFRGIWQLDLATGFDPLLIAVFYGAGTACFVVGLLGARLLFRRDWEDCVAIGFVCLFSNSLMLGLPITERAFGTAALTGNYAIIAIHAPFCYALGITVMEIVRARTPSPLVLAGRVGRAMFRNALVIGLALGLALNLSGLGLPAPVSDALDLVVATAVPTALFGLGGILYQYRPEGDLRIIAAVCAVSLLLHPGLVWLAGRAVDLPQPGLRSALVTSAMAPGVNAYLFADLYGRARRIAASSVLIATVASIVTIWFWLAQLA